MMLREHLQSFLVASILVSVTSKQCLICGDGYKVGNPFAKTSVQCQNQTACTCNELALAGLQGSIPIGKCANVSSAVFSTCDCQEKTTYAASAAPYLFGIRPIIRLPVMIAPTPTPAGASNESTLFNVLFTVILVGFFCCCCCLIQCLKHGGLCRRWWVYLAPSRGIEVTQQNSTTIPVTTTTVAIENHRSRRSLVLAVLFPKEGMLESDEHTGGRKSNLKYDPQSKHYVFCDDAPDATVCSICMELLAPTDDTVTSLCSHTYHRECIMSWLQCDHDECPNCRQAMWEPKTYEMVDECIKNGDSSSPFAV